MNVAPLQQDTIVKSLKADVAASIDSAGTIDHKHSMKGEWAIGMIEGRVDDPTVD
jgi:hypothetical protein